MKLVVLFIFCLVLLQAFAEAISAANEGNSVTNMHGEDEGSLYRKYHHHGINCNYACARRCSKSSRKNVCSRACKTCCFRCRCVPPGTYGHTQVCPCYARLRTHGNRPKCP